MPQENTAPSTPAPAGAERLPYWANVSSEMDDLGLTKAEFRILSHILRRAGKDSVCDASVRTMARVTRTHPVYVRWIIRHLLKRKLIIRTIRPGRVNILEPAPKFEWLAVYGPNAIARPRDYEETADEATAHVLWARLWEIMPGAPKARFDKNMKEDRHLFERVLADVEDRVKRGKGNRADSLPPVRDVTALWNFTWTEFKKANPKR
jgi:hypothetical protein